MVFVDENMNITMTRGDTGEFIVECLLDDETIYTPQEGDVVTFAVKHKDMRGDSYRDYVDPDPLCEIIIPNDSMILEIRPEDTRPLGFGKYDYQVDIEFANGKVSTFIDATLKITKEVHKDGN